MMPVAFVPAPDNETGKTVTKNCPRSKSERRRGVAVVVKLRGVITSTYTRVALLTSNNRIEIDVPNVTAVHQITSFPFGDRTTSPDPHPSDWR